MKNLISSQGSTFNQTPYLFKTRFGLGIDTKPEKLIAAAHAGCFTMLVGATHGHAGFTANNLNTDVGIAEISSLVFHWI